jgi:PAS domain S-box-containing protein
VAASPQHAGSRADAYVVAWVGGAALIAAAFVVFGDHGVWRDVGAATIALYIGAVVLAERIDFRLTVEGTHTAFTLIEVAITAGLLLLPAPIMVVGAMIGTSLSQWLKGLRGAPVWFNVAIATVGSVVAVSVMSVVPAVGPLVAGQPILGALLGMIGYGVVNAAAIAGVVLRSSREAPREELRRQAPFFISYTFAATSVGVVVAALWVTEPVLSLLALVPAAAISLAAHGIKRTNELLAEVRTERDRLTLVVDGASDGIILLDQQGEIRLWSRGMEGMTGITTETAVGRPVADVLTDARRRAMDNVRGAWLLEPLADGRAQGQRVHRELGATLIHRDGTAREVRESHALLTDDRGRLIGDVVVVRDVSRQAELERLRSDFVARVSHELRSPLTPIRGLAQTLRLHDAQLTHERRQQVLDHLVERSDHLARLIDDLLLVTRVDTEDLHDLIHVSTIGLGQVIGEEVNRFCHLHPRRRVEVDQPAGEVLALADPGHLARVVAAVLDNADRYSPPNEAVRVTISEGSGGPMVRISDRGPGIPEAQRDAVFEPFHRLEDPLTMRTGGVGLGLFLARRLTELMGGTLALATPPDGVGTILELRLRAGGRRSEGPPVPTFDRPIGQRAAP